MATIKSLAGLSYSNLVEHLKEHKKQPCSSGEKRVKSLMTTVDHYLIVWEPENCTLLVKNLLDTDSSKDQRGIDRYLKISPTIPPIFEVENVQANLDGSLVILSGPQGVLFVELPPNWTNLEANKVKSEKISRSSYIEEKLLACSPKIRILQTEFHPGSPTNSHIAILTSDNYMRIYDVYSPQRPEKTILVGSKSNMTHSRSVNATTFSAFSEDTAIAFDFGLPSGNSHSVREDAVPIVMFPVYILFGNGEVYMFFSSVQSNSSRAPKTIVSGPLTMLPQAEDNYGSDACSILCLPVSPPVLVIANRHGNIHHAVLLPRETDLDDSVDDLAKSNLADDFESLLSWASLAPPDLNSNSEMVLYVTETLELDGDVLDDNNGLSPFGNGINENRIQLKEDPSCSSRYFITHDFGIHGVVVPLVIKLNELAIRNNQETDSDETNRAVLEESVVEFILCSRMKSSAAAPPQGFVLYPLPPTLLVLLDSADIHVVSLSRLLKPALKLVNESRDLTEKVASRESFETHIRRQLQRTHSQPKLSLPPGTEPTKAEMIKLFSRSVQTLREEYIMKQDVVREELEKRSHVLQLHLQQQYDELDLIQQSKADLTNKAHDIAEKYEEALDSQHRFVKRVEKVLYEIQRRSPVLTDAEKQMGQQLRHLESKLSTLKQSLDSLKRRESLYGSKVYQPQEVGSSKVYLSEEQRTTLNDILTKQSEEITALLKGIQLAKKKLVA